VAAALKSLLRAPPAREACMDAARPYTVAASAQAYLAAMGLAGGHYPESAP
jgi:hypothetical protein